jgi:drug/metabolite transporter, DME family
VSGARPHDGPAVAPGRRRAYRQMTVVGVLWGTIGPTAAYLDRHTAIDPLQVSWWRLVIALAPCVAIAAVAARRTRLTVTPRVVALAVGVGLANAGFQYAYFAAVASAGIAVPTLVALGLGPVLVAVGDTVVFASRPDRRTLASLVVALGGLALLVLDGPAEATVTGVGLAVASAVGYATATLGAGPASRRLGPSALNAFAVVTGAVALTPVVLVTGGPGTPDSAGGVAALLYLGLGVSGLAYALYFAAARALPSTHVVIITLLEPVIATVIAAVAFDEALTVATIIGGVLLLGAVAALRPEEPQAVG